MKLFVAIISVILITASILCFSSCMYGNKTETSFKRENKITKDSLEYFREVELFLGPCELADTAYTLIGRITVIGKEGATEKELSELLSKKAFALGANAIFQITVSTKTRTRGSTFLDILSAIDDNFENSSTDYQSLEITGEAVLIKN